MPMISSRKVFLPFYAIDADLKLNIRAEVGFTRTTDQQEPTINPSLEIVESSKTAVWYRIPPLPLEISNRQLSNNCHQLDFIRDDARGLSLFHHNVIYAGPPELSRFFSSKSMEKQMSDSIFDDSMTVFSSNKKKNSSGDNNSKSISWKPYSNNFDNDNLDASLEPFLIDGAAAKRYYLDLVSRELLQEFMKMRLKKIFLADDIRNLRINIDFDDKRQPQVTPIAIPFIVLTHDWLASQKGKDRKLYILIDSSRCRVFTNYWFSPTKTFAFLTSINLLLGSSYSGIISITASPILDAILPAAIGSLLVAFMPRLEDKLSTTPITPHDFHRPQPTITVETTSEPTKQETTADPPITNNDTATKPQQPTITQPQNTAWRRRIKFQARKNPIIDAKMAMELDRRDPLGYYKALGLEGGESQNEIVAAYLRMVKRFHPDMHNDEYAKLEAKEAFQSVVKAYNVLKDEESRLRYDKNGAVSTTTTSTTTNPS